MKSDVVIIGSGLGGLLCARILSERGLGVTVLERHRVAGGCLQSYSRRGVCLDTGLHYVGGLAEGSRLRSIFDRLGLMRLPWQRLDAEGFDLITIGGETFPFVEGYRNYADTLADRFPKEREALHRYVELMERADSMALGDSEVQSLCAVNAYDWLHETFRDELLIDVLSGNMLKTELRRESLPLFSFFHATSSFIGGGAWRLRGCGNDLVGLLVKDIVGMGGRVVTSAQVDELTETGGRITAAHCTNGDTYEAATFISDIHPQQTFALVKESQKLSRLFRRRIDMLGNTCGMLTVSLLTDGSLPYFNHNRYVYSGPVAWQQPFPTGKFTDGVDRVLVSCMAPHLPSRLCPTPPVVDLLTPVPLTLFEQWGESRVGHRRYGYDLLKNHLADQCLQLAATVVPGLAEAVTARYVSTPLTWRDYTLTPGGSAYGLRKDSRQPLLTMLSPRTPIGNLLLTGQNLMLHGLEGVTMTALQTCEAVNGET